jgi:hypothetical protein
MPVTKSPEPTRIYQIKVTLKESEPPIWRRIQVKGDVTLYRLHRILQTVMGWEDCHLHEFLIARQYYGSPEEDAHGDGRTKSDRRYRLNQVAPRAGVRFTYEYDFGDCWQHLLLVEKVLPPEDGVRYPRCLEGGQAAPPEDVGGIWGYYTFLEHVRDPQCQEHDTALDWVGSEFDPEAFDLAAANRELAGIK